MQDYNMKDYDKIKEPSYLKYWDVNNLYDSAMSQKSPVSNFEWTEDSSQFVKNYHEESSEGYFLKVDIQYLKNYTNFTMTYHFHQKEWNLKKSKSWLLIYMIKGNMPFT